MAAEVVIFFLLFGEQLGANSGPIFFCVSGLKAVTFRSNSKIGVLHAWVLKAMHVALNPSLVWCHNKYFDCNK